MKEKYENLLKLREMLNITVKGIENYPRNEKRPTLAIANHSCLMDIFYLPMALPEPQVTVVSSRVSNKNIENRKEQVNDLLYALPLEPTGGLYANLTLSAASQILTENISLNIFPEGVYNDRSKITRGRTGTARILYQAREQGINPYFLPVAIDVKSKDSNLNRYIPNLEDEITVNILEPIDYEDYFQEFQNGKDKMEKNYWLHKVIDEGMKEIADALNLEYSQEYKTAIPKNNIMFQDGSTISLEEGLYSENIARYQKEIEEKTKEFIKVLKK